MANSSSCMGASEEKLYNPEQNDISEAEKVRKKIYNYYSKYSKYQEQVYSWPMTVFERHSDSEICLCYSPDGNYLAIGSPGKTVKIWNIKKQREEFILYGFSNFVNFLTYSPDGNYLAALSENRTVKIWNIKERKEEFTLNGHLSLVNCCSYTSDGNYLATGSSDKTVKIWDIKERREEFSLNGHSESVRCCSYTPDGNYLATGSSDKTIKIWNIKEQREEFTLNGHLSDIRCCSYSPDGNYLATGSADNTVKIWNINEQREKFTLNGHSGSVRCCSYSPDGNYLATGSADKTVKIWNIKKEREEFTLNDYSDMVNCCSYSPDGNYLATGSTDFYCVGEIKIWDIKEQREEFTFNEYPTEFLSCTCTSNGSYLVTGSNDNKFRIWKIKEQKEDFNLNDHSKLNIENKFENKFENLREFFKPDNLSITGIKKPLQHGYLTIQPKDDGTISVWNNSECKEDFLLSYDTNELIGLYFIENEKNLVAVYSDNIFRIAYWNKLLFILNENLSMCAVQRENIELLFKDAKVGIFIHNYYNEYNKSKVKIEEQLSLIVSKLLQEFIIVKSSEIALNLSNYLVKFVNLNYRIQHLNFKASTILKNFFTNSQNKRVDIKEPYESQILMFLYDLVIDSDTKQKIRILLDQLIKMIS